MLLGTVLIDYMLKLHVVPRFVVIAAALVGLGYVAIRWIVKPVLARLTLSDVAGHLESVFPEFDDRLRSTVDFVQNSAAIPGSEMMKDRVVTEATTMVQKTDLSQAVITRPVWYSLSGAVGAIALLVALCLMLPKLAEIARDRLLGGTTPWPKSVEIQAASLPTRVPVGQRIDLNLTLKKGDNASQKAMVYYQYDNGPVQKEYMIRGNDGHYTAAIDARSGAQKLTVWMTAGDDETDRKMIEVVPRLAIQGVQAEINAPEYAKTPPTKVDLAKSPAYMVTGSKVGLRVNFNKPLDPNKAVEFMVIPPSDDKKGIDPGIVADRAVANAPVGNFTAKESFRFRIRATDLDGFDNTALEEYEVVVKPDQLPSVVIESPKKNVDRTPDGYLPLQILGEDDFGLASMRLIVDRVATAAPDPNNPNAAAAATPGPKHWEIALKDWNRIDGNGERQRFRLNMDWELKQTLGALKPGDILEYFVEVRDNYQAQTQENGKTVIATHAPQLSSKLRVNILSEDEIGIIGTDTIRQLNAQTKSVETSQRSNQAETKTLQDETKNKPELSKGDKSALENASSRESTIVSQTTSLASKLDELQKMLAENRVKNPELNEIAKEAKQALEQAASKPMTEAANDLNRAGQSKTNSLDPQQQQKAQENRNQSLKQSQDHQEQAAQKLGDAIKAMDKVGTMADTIRKWQADFDKQKELLDELKNIGKEAIGKKKDDLTPEQKQRLDKNAEEQKKAADNVEQHTKDLEKMANQLSKSDPQAAEAMKQAADQAKSQQISQQQRQASAQAQQNQQAQAQNAQQQAQLGIEVVLNTLKDADKRKLEQLIKLLDEAKKNIEELVRRQAGHNIDNLDLQGGEAKAKAMTKEELDVLYAKAKRDQKQNAKVDLAAIASGQETTERNTRNVAKDIEDQIKEGGAIIAQDLIRAAGKMGYAIIDLRDKKLATAYSPHQVEALNALDQALKKTEDALNAAQRKMDEKKAEAIKARLEKMRAEEMEKVVTPTQTIEKSRKADHSLPRENAVVLNNLPGKQGELSKGMGEIGEALRELGGIVYTEAAKDVVNDMNEVKEDLGKQKTGETTQLEEARIIEQLDAMIDSMKQEIDKSKFDQKGGGGKGNGNPRSKLPSEVELRLLKAIQTSINKNTTNAGNLPKEKQDKVALVNLGNRQGKLRTLLDGLIKQATGGKEGLKAEPDPKDKLPEEAGKEAIENQEMDQDLLGGDPNAQKESKQINRVGDRMARSRQRLALDNDPGKMTQEIQKRIVVDIDDMIKQAQQQQANSQSKPGQGQQQQQAQGQQPGQQQGNQSQPNNAQNAAQQSTVSGGGSREAQLSAKINETNKEWGNISPRLRQAVIEGSSEKVPEKYRKMVEDYYRGVSTGGNK